MDVEDEYGNGFFLQPCTSYCDGCSIYSQRPKQCANFECKLLKSVEQKQLNFDLAVETINEVKQRKTTIEEKLAPLQLNLQSQSFNFRMVELKKHCSKSNLNHYLYKNIWNCRQISINSIACFQQNLVFRYINSRI